MRSICVMGLVLAAGCAATTGNLKFKSFGTYRPELENKVVGDYEADKSEGPTEADVKVYSGTLPEGISVKDGVITATPESGRTVLGTFEWRQGVLAPPEKDGPREFGKIARAAGGNEVVLVDVVSDRGYLRSASGFILKVASPAAAPASTQM